MVRYGLLRLRFNDDAAAPRAIFPELNGCALIRELHVYGTLRAACRGEKHDQDERPQHIGALLQSFSGHVDPPKTSFESLF